MSKWIGGLAALMLVLVFLLMFSQPAHASGYGPSATNAMYTFFMNHPKS